LRLNSVVLSPVVSVVSAGQVAEKRLLVLLMWIGKWEELEEEHLHLIVLACPICLIPLAQVGIDSA
jgi:hypothetical protein